MKKSIEQLGQFTGETFGPLFLERLRKKVEAFELHIEGVEHLESVQKEPFLLVANHIMPESSAAQQSQLSPDAFVLQHIVRELRGEALQIVAKADDGWWAENVYRYFQKHVGQPFGKGVSKGVGFIPLLKNPGSFNRDFLAEVDAVVQENRGPILIFPEGHWYADYEPTHELESGAATIAKRHGLPIVPAYINGANSWEPETAVRVSFGEHFLPHDLSKVDITEAIRSRLTQLQQDNALGKVEGVTIQ